MVTPNPSVSVVIPAYNAESTILDAVTSALRQSHCTVEIIVCDDASTDCTKARVESLGHPDVKLFSNESNMGPGLSRDKAIEKARAPWVALLDADDKWHPERLYRLLDAATRTRSDIAFDDIMLCHDTGDRLIPWRPVHGSSAFGRKATRPIRVPIENYIAARRLLIQPIIRTDLIRKNGIRHSNRQFGEDAEFYLRLALAGAELCYQPDAMYQYRISPGSLTAQAKDPGLMRKCMEECSQWKGWQPKVQAAFSVKISSLRKNEALYELANLARHGRIVSACKLLASHPYLLTSLPGKTVRQLHYQAHRIWHGGFKR